ncbi:putative transporter subunit: ATP-binding component of ABC superfamily [uncultured Eubacteriales bacterium]|uniref:Putative transporter subunit: ATP-binding component of ABC superfamily n=1 Tax=uncultured Eubacteriales bacterium TaxID=172733 RepID=A0A212KA97_9FIRM|nr:putative transporter subunit: ATP-binding component of ABC superfamily [uncultured Eubacteriales bacterium]
MKEVFLLSQIELRNVFYRNGENTILSNFSVEIEAGDYISIMGQSGSGKSTFLRLCCHLITPTEGSIAFYGNDIMRQDPIELRKKICYCFQTPVLFGDTVEDNILFVYSIRKQAIDHERVNSLFSQFNMNHVGMKQEIKTLSGGEKQRLALIQTLLFVPDVLLLDEVTSALDVDNTLIVENAIKEMNQEGITILWVTHNPEQGKRYANKLLTIEKGKIESLEVLR